nr:hypothetical protein [Tanacetum cinerariifolium]
TRVLGMSKDSDGEWCVSWKLAKKGGKMGFVFGRETLDESEGEKTEESFDPIPRTPEESEDADNNEEDQGLRIGEEERMHEEEEVDELYHRVKLLEVNFSNLPGIVNQYMHQQMSKAVREVVQTQTDRLQDSIQRENDEFLNTIDDNMKKIIKEQVKTQVKAQVTRILPRIEESVNAQLEAKVLTRSSHSSRTSYAVAADLSEMELKKILIDKMEGNKESAILKRRREDDDQEVPSAGSDRGSKRRREGGEHASASTPSESATGSADRSTTGTQSQQLSASEYAFAEEPVQTTCQMEKPSHPVFETGAKDQPIVQTSQHPEWFSQPSDFKRLRLQEIEDMMLLLVQGKLSNLTVEERFAFNVSLRMFTRSIVIQRHVEDLQLGVESYQKRLNLTKPDTYRSDLNDGTLNDVRNALDDRLKGIRMQYLPTTIWRKWDKDRAAAMIQAIDKMLKTRRIMKSLERFVGGRQYEGDFRLLQRTI